MYTVSPNNSTTSLSDDDVDDIDGQDMQVSFHYPVDVSPQQWASITRGGSTNIDSRLAQLASAASSPSSTPFTLAALLPAEILIHVLRQLHSTKDLYHALLVSRTWCSCAVELLWHRPSFSTHTAYLRLFNVLTSPLPTTFDYASFVRRLNFVAIAPDLTDDLFTPLSRCAKLERLTMVGCHDISDVALLSVLPYTRNMVALDLSCIPHLSDGPVVAVASAAPKLQGINLSGCKNITDAAVSAIAKHCALIRRVKLANCKLVTDESICALARGCPMLLEIDLNGCPRTTDFSTRELWTHNPHLRELRLAQCTELSDLGFPAAPSVVSETHNTVLLSQPNGNRIEIQPFPNSIVAQSPTANDIIAPLRLTRLAEHLRILDLTACALLTDDAVAGIIAAAPKLRNLVLAKCPQLTNVGVESISKLGKHLHYLHLGHASSITDRSVRTLARSCTRLRYIDLACCPLLTDMSVFELAGLPKLRRIGLVRVTNLTDQAIFSLADRHQTLERIHLSYCENITVLSIHFLLDRLTKLTHLSLTGVPAFRRPELQRFCRSPPGEFNTTQRAAFCVYSGKGVNDLRKYLADLMAHVQAAGTDTGENDTDYDAEDDDDGTPVVPRNSNIPGSGKTAAELYAEMQRQRPTDGEVERRGRDRNRGRAAHPWHSVAVPLPYENAEIETEYNIGEGRSGTNGSAVKEEDYEENPDTPLRRTFGSSSLASMATLPLSSNVTVRRGLGNVSSSQRQPVAGPSTLPFIEDTRGSSLATTPSPTEHHRRDSPEDRSSEGSSSIHNARNSPGGFADGPIVESNAPSPVNDSSHHYSHAFPTFPHYGSGGGRNDTRQNSGPFTVNNGYVTYGQDRRHHSFSPFATTPSSPTPIGGGASVYTPDIVLSNLNNRIATPGSSRRPQSSRHTSGSAVDGALSTSPQGRADLDPSVYNIARALEETHLRESQGTGNANTPDDLFMLQYPYRQYLQQAQENPTNWPPQSLITAYEQKERFGEQQQQAQIHNPESPIPFLSASPTTRELQESVHSAFSGGSDASSNVGVTAMAHDPSNSGILQTERSESLSPVAPMSPASGTLAPDAARGRSMRRSLKNTISAAEHYASALFFGRGHANGSGAGSGNVSSASSSSVRDTGRMN